MITNDGRNIIVRHAWLLLSLHVAVQGFTHVQCAVQYAAVMQIANRCRDAVAPLVVCLAWRVLQGVLKGYDQCINVVLDDSFERVYSTKEPVEAVELGLYIVRGDNMYGTAAFRLSTVVCMRARCFGATMC